MDVNKLLGSYVSNISSIVEWLFVLVLVLFIPILYFAFRKKETEVSANLDGIEATLKKVLEATRHQPTHSTGANAELTESETVGEESTGAGASSGGKSSGPVGVPSAEVEKIKAQVAEREKKISELNAQMADLQKQAAAAKAAGGGASADAAGFESRVKDLEARLHEYEIIEDDIANLSLYKEENARLKNELNRMQTSGGALSAADVTTPSADQIAKEVGVAPADLGPSESLSDALTKAEIENPSPDIDAPGGELDEAMKGLEELAAQSIPAEEPAPDLVAELAQMVEQKSVQPPEAAPAPAPAPKVAVPEPKPEQVVAAPAEPAAEGPDVLKSFDADKIAEEAGNLKVEEGAAASAPQEEGDVGQKLIDEFENFMKDVKS